MVPTLPVVRGRRAAGAAALIAGALLAAGGVPEAAAQGPEPAPHEAKVVPSGLVVVAIGQTTDAAWPLAQGIYGQAALRPAHVDEAHARVLAGEPPAEGAQKDLRDLAEVRAAIRGDDAPSRQLLASVAKDLHVRAIVVLDGADHPPSARVFLPETGAFDAARYSADATDAGAGVAWGGAVSSLTRAYGAPAAATPVRAASAATHETPPPRPAAPRSKSFYESPWFWGALGAAAFAGAGVFFATRGDSSSDTVHLQMQVPR